MSNYDNNTTRRFPAAFGGQRRGGNGGYNNRGGAGRGRYQEVRYPAPEKKEEPKTVDLNSEMNFPSLGGGSAWGSKPVMAGAGVARSTNKSFAELANGWKEADDAEKERKILEEEEARREQSDRERYCKSSRILGFTRSRLHTEKYDEYDDEEYNNDEYDNFVCPTDAPTLEPEWKIAEDKKRFPPTYSSYDRGSRWEDTEEDDDY